MRTSCNMYTSCLIIAEAGNLIQFFVFPGYFSTLIVWYYISTRQVWSVIVKRMKIQVIWLVWGLSSSLWLLSVIRIVLERVLHIWLVFCQLLCVHGIYLICSFQFYPSEMEERSIIYHFMLKCDICLALQPAW